MKNQPPKNLHGSQTSQKNQEINRLVAEARVSQSIKRLRDRGLNLPDRPQQNSPSKKPTE